MRILKSKKFLHGIILCAILAGLAGHFFGVSKIAAKPWWCRNGNDTDCVQTTSALTLINDGGPLLHVFYPAITSYSIQGFALRISALLNQKNADFLKLKEVSNMAEALSLIQRATYVTRFLILFFMAGFLILFYAVMNRLTRLPLLSGAMTLMLLLMPMVMYHSHVLRPEMPSLLFFLAGFYCAVGFIQKPEKQRGNSSLLLTGLFFGLAVFSKIQIAPAVAAVFLFLTVFLFRQETDTDAMPCVGAALLNLLIFPWWALRRPAHITSEFITANPENIFNKLYGPPPGKESWAFVVLAAFVVLPAVSLLAAGLRPRFKDSRIWPRLQKIVMFMSLFFIGVSLSIYLICLPSAASLRGYVMHTKTVVYTTMSNYLNAAFLEKGTFGFDNIREIYREWLHMPLSFGSMIYGLIFLAGCSVFGFLKKEFSKKSCALSLGFAALAVVFSVAASLRYPKILHWYQIYPDVFYMLAIGVMCAAVWKYLTEKRFWKIRTGCVAVFAVLVLTHGIRQGMAFNSPDTCQGQTCYDEYNYCRWQAEYFWAAVDYGYYRSGALTGIKDSAKEEIWGNDFNSVSKIISGLPVRRLENFTDEDRTAQVDMLIDRYQRSMALKTYFYELYLNRGREAEISRNFSEALRNYTSAVNVFKYFPDAYEERADLFRRARQKSNAEKDAASARAYRFYLKGRE